MRVLIGYDGSECADAALDDLRRAGLPAEGEALVLSVADVWPHLADGRFDGIGPGADDWLLPSLEGAQRVAQESLSAAKQTAERGADRIRADLPGWAVRFDAESDAPHWAIVRRADTWEPDLVVLGSHGRSAFGRLILGSVSLGVLTHARCSVRIGRRRPRSDGGPTRILIGIDGSVGAAAAVSAVSMRQWPAGSEVRVVAALDTAISTALPVGAATAWREARFERAHDWVSHAVSRVARELHESGLTASPLVTEGDPKKVLVFEAERWGADCIFVGAKGLSRLERFLVGSVSTAVAARAPCSVEVVRAAV